jgi:hypothetical protein
MGRTLSLADHVDEIRLSPARTRGGALARGLRRIPGLSSGDSPAAGSLRATDAGLALHAPGDYEDGLEVPWGDIRKLVLDDGNRWGYVSGVCRFPVYDLRPDGSGSGVLIGPLWSHAGSLLPEGCPRAEVDPVPADPPNLALILEPPLSLAGEAAAIMLLCVEDPEGARELLAGRPPFGDLAHDDLEYLTEAGRGPRHAFFSEGHSAASA